MLNFKKVNCKKVIINAVIVFCVFALTIVIIRIVNHKDKEAVMADLTQNEWEISGLYRDEYDKVQKCKTRMVFLEDGTYFTFNLLIGILITDSVGDVFFSLILIIHLFLVLEIERERTEQVNSLSNLPKYGLFPLYLAEC